uniref:Uncharacterized protein n=1 Tax=Meloidogyne incognita TaxID=6306 RepID=A0A914MFI0_MELIC
MDLMLDIEFAGGGNEAAKDVPSWNFINTNSHLNFISIRLQNDFVQRFGCS